MANWTNEFSVEYSGGSRKSFGYVSSHADTTVFNDLNTLTAEQMIEIHVQI